MRRRWMLWAAGGLALVAVALALVTAKLPPAPPYDFLRGHAPIEIEYPPGTAKPAYSVVMYSFRDDYASVISRVEPELKSKGLAKAPTFSSSGFFSETYVRERFSSRATKDASPWIPRVSVMRDAKVLKDGQVPEYEKGWVTVVVEGAPEPSWWESVRAWMGL